MTGPVRFSEGDFATDVPPSVRDPLILSGLPAEFQRFEITFEQRLLSSIQFDGLPYLSLASTSSGQIAVDFRNGAVCWLQNDLQDSLISTTSYRQFINSGIPEFVQCIRQHNMLAETAEWNSRELKLAIGEIDPPAIDESNEGVWFDVVNEWESGLYL